jgi:hypothetical protein
MAGKKAQEVKKKIDAMPEGPAKKTAQTAYKEAMKPTGGGTGRLSNTERDSILGLVGNATSTNQTQVDPNEAARRAAQEIEDAREQRQRRDSIALLQATLEQYGLGSLSNVIVDLKQQGFSDDVVEVKLQDTPEWKQRFVGNELRRKSGLPVLRPDEYLGLEAAYKKVLRDAQLPETFYDQTDDFGKFMANDISSTELQERVNIANLSIQNADPFYTDSLRRMYGLNDGDMTAFALDPERALPAITRQVKAAQFGAEATRQRLPGISTQMAERYTDTFGVTQQQARQGFEQVAMIQPEAQRLSDVFAGQTPAVGLEETTSAVFGGDQSAAYKQRLQRLSEMEQSLFAGQSGVGAGSLTRRQSGQF